TLAHIAGVPILPCVIVGSDRLYSARRWLPASGGRTPVWIAFGNPISHFPELQKSEARARIEFELMAAFKNLYAELQQTFHLSADDLPHPPRERMNKSSRHPEPFDFAQDRLRRGTTLQKRRVSPPDSSTPLRRAQNDRLQR